MRTANVAGSACPSIQRTVAPVLSARLAAVLEERGNDASATLQRLQDWCREAEATGIEALERFAARLRGYVLVPASR